MFICRNATSNGLKAKKEEGKNKKDDVKQRIEVKLFYYNEN